MRKPISGSKIKTIITEAPIHKNAGIVLAYLTGMLMGNHTRMYVMGTRLPMTKLGILSSPCQLTSRSLVKENFDHTLL